MAAQQGIRRKAHFLGTKIKSLRKRNNLTLEDLSGQYDVSRERIRQIEVRAFEKLQKRMQELAREKGILATA